MVSKVLSKSGGHLHEYFFHGVLLFGSCLGFLFCHCFPKQVLAWFCNLDLYTDAVDVLLGTRVGCTQKQTQLTSFLQFYKNCSREIESFCPSCFLACMPSEQFETFTTFLGALYRELTVT